MFYYSTISISTGAQTGESFNIALVCIGEDRAYFHFSKTKLKIISELFSPHAVRLFKASMEGVQESVHAYNLKEISKEELWEYSNKPKELSFKYLSYLSRYNNNLVQFSKPVQVDLAINDSVFEAFFQKYVYKQEAFNPVVKQEDKNKRLYKEFLSQAEPYVNTKFKVDQEFIPSLVMPKQVDMIGKNGAIHIAHFVKFDANLQTLKHNIDSYMYLALSTEVQENKGSSCFLIGEEPAKTSKNHKIWKAINETPNIKYIPFDERGRILEHFEKEEVRPLVINE